MPGGCQRCTGSGLCTAATCNYDCRMVTETECETIIMAGGGDVPPEGYSAYIKERTALFSQGYRVERCTGLMTKAGISEGDWISHINGKFPQSLDDFAAMVLDLPKGTVLKVWKGSERIDITL
jgi:hypothetical protein